MAQVMRILVVIGVLTYADYITISTVAFTIATAAAAAAAVATNVVTMAIQIGLQISMITIIRT